MKIAIINGANLNMLGYREQDHYGSNTYDDLVNLIKEHPLAQKYELDFFQSNSEGALIDYLHHITINNYDALIINPGAYTHYSYALYDALLIFKGYKVEVHLSDISNRDDFRSQLITTKACDTMISGLKMQSYIKGFELIDTKL
ncbi:MAG: type II 3-dehydroquinate dehydratase [Bacilli bacterium]